MQIMNQALVKDQICLQHFGLTDKELQMFRKLFGHKNPEELEQAIVRTDTKEKYNKILYGLNIKQIVLRIQIRTKIGIHAQD